MKVIPRLFISLLFTAGVIIMTLSSAGAFVCELGETEISSDAAIFKTVYLNGDSAGKIRMVHPGKWEAFVSGQGALNDTFSGDEIAAEEICRIVDSISAH